VQVVYGRITKEQHLAAAREAREKNAKRKTVEEFKVKGFKDVWTFDRLPYSDLARNSSIPLHGSMLYAWNVAFYRHFDLRVQFVYGAPRGKSNG